ncbi:MAG: phosphoglycerate dehydrogenase [Pyrinomonadaceae bacterium]|nr:phosphoglycerate dehydrogenase [Pyrinomonadaceae bacterium]
MNNIKIFVADDVSEDGLRPLRAAGFTVDKRTGLKDAALHDAVRDCAGLIVRSETKVTPQVMEEAVKLRAIGRAGVGVDNIDVAEASKRGIIVMNAPDGNTMTTAEHTFALILALARRVPHGHVSLREGRWERKRFVGVELRGKTLGIVGLGRIGRVVANRARAFEMKVIAYDPFVSEEAARNMEIEIAPLEEVFAAADFITVHTPLTSETRGIIGAEAFKLMKPSVRIINCARGGLVDEAALYEAIKEGRVAGAALDVFEKEPPSPDHPLFTLDEVIATPHLGASTREAQEGVAVTVAEQMRDYFLTGAPRGAVNMPSISADELNKLQPYMQLAERLGKFHAQLTDDTVREVNILYAGDVAEMDAAPVTRAFIAGLLRDMSTRVNVVNALLIAEERGINVTASYKRVTSEKTPALQTTVTTIKGVGTVSGSLFGGETDGRIVEINGFGVEAIPRGNVLVMRNADVPGVIGQVGTSLGRRGVNISRFQLGRREPGGEAMAIIEIDEPLAVEALNELRAIEQVTDLRQINF